MRERERKKMRGRDNSNCFGMVLSVSALIAISVCLLLKIAYFNIVFSEPGRSRRHLRQSASGLTPVEASSRRGLRPAG